MARINRGKVVPRTSEAAQTWSLCSSHSRSKIMAAAAAPTSSNSSKCKTQRINNGWWAMPTPNDHKITRTTASWGGTWCRCAKVVKMSVLIPSSWMGSLVLTSNKHSKRLVLRLHNLKTNRIAWWVRALSPAQASPPMATTICCGGWPASPTRCTRPRREAVAKLPTTHINCLSPTARALNRQTMPVWVSMEWMKNCYTREVSRWDSPVIILATAT